MAGEHAPPPLPEETAERYLRQDLLEYFSESTLELVGFDAAVNVIKAKATLQDAVHAGDKAAVVSERIEKNASGWEAAFPIYDSPEAERACKQLVQAFHDAPWQKMFLLDHWHLGLPVYQCFEQTRNSIPAVNRMIIERYMEAYEEELRILQEVEPAAKALLARHDQTDSDSEKGRLMSEVSKEFSKVLPAQPAKDMWQYLSAARIKESFEQAEQVCGKDLTRLLRRFKEICAGMEEYRPGESPVSRNTLSLEDIKYYMRRMKVVDTQADIGPRVNELFGTFLRLVPETSRRRTEEIMQVGMVAIRAAETTLGIGTSVSVKDTDFSQWPYTLLDPKNSNLQQEAEALLRVMHGSRLSQVREEIRLALTTMESQYGHSLDAPWEKVTQPAEWLHSLTTARQTVAGMIARRLNLMKDGIKPLADVVEGRKTRQKKSSKQKGVYSAEAAAESIYDMLHREGSLVDAEKSLAAAIASGRWEAFKDLREAVASEYAFLAAFAEEAHCPDVLNQHPLASVMAFSEQAVLAGIQAKLVGRADKVLAALNVEQTARLRTAFAALSNEA